MSKPKIPYAKGRKFCIFCGNPADSEEHIWPQWAKDILPSGEYHKNETWLGFLPRAKLLRDYTRQGSSATLRIKRVCSTCNSGWMSAYETAVRPKLEGLVQGKSTWVDDKAKATLCEYLTYKLMLLDWFDDEPLMPPELPQEFYRSRAIPPELRIWALDCVAEDWQIGFHTQAVGIKQFDGNRSPVPPNVKSLAVGFGNLFVFALFTSKVKVNIHFNDVSAFRLAPMDERVFVWPFERLTSESGAKFITGTLPRISKSPGMVITDHPD